MKLIFDKKNIFNQFLLFKTWRRAVWRFKFYQIFIRANIKKNQRKLILCKPSNTNFTQKREVTPLIQSTHEIRIKLP